MAIPSDFVPYLISAYNDAVLCLANSPFVDVLHEAICVASPDAIVHEPISTEHIRNQIVKEECIKVGEKTTICVLTLKNGFEVIGKAGCINPENYNHEIGSQIARGRAVDQIWLVEGYLRQQQRFEAND
jgi:hypothetical protein